MSNLEVVADAELMLQPLPEKTLTDAKEFRVVYDGKFDPAVFGFRTGGQLALIAKDDNGNNKLIDLGQQFGLPTTEAISAMGLWQNPQELTIFFAFGTKTSDGSGNVYLVQPFRPEGTGWYRKLEKSSLLSSAESALYTPRSIHFGTQPDATGFPFISVVISEQSQSRKDVLRIQVDKVKKSWTWAKDFAFPKHIDQMKDYLPATIPTASGIVGLDVTQNTPKLTFAGLSGAGSGPKTPTTVDLPITESPLCLAASLDRDRCTDIFVASKTGILHIPAQLATATDSRSPGPVTPNLIHPMLEGVSQMHIAQNDKALTIWALNGDGNIIYQPAILQKNQDEDYDDAVRIGDPVPLVTLDSLAKRNGSSNKARIIRFNALIHPKTGERQIYILTDDGSVSWLHQSPDSKLWSEEPFKIPDNEDVTDINTYTCHIRVVDGQKVPQTNTEIQIKASSQTRGSINGTAMHLSGDLRSVKTDANGTLTLILPASDLKVPTITLSAPNLSPVEINPAEKAMKTLSEKDKTALQNARTPSGKAIFPRADDSTQSALKELQNFYQKKDVTPAAAASSASHARVHERGIFGDAWDKFHGVVNGAWNKVKSWAYQAGKFILDTGRKVWNFVVDTAEKCLKAVSALLELIGDLIEDALAWLASKIDWSSVLDVKTVFNDVFDSALAIGEEVAAEGEKVVDDFFSGIESWVAKVHTPIQVGGDAAKALKPVPSQRTGTDHSKNPCFQWGNYHVEHGGVQKGTSGIVGIGEGGLGTDVVAIYRQFIEPLWNNIKQCLEDIWRDIQTALKPDSKLNFLDVVKNIGVDLLQTLIRTLKLTFKSMIGVIRKMFVWMKDILNKELNIWCISKLYRKITNGEKLTMKNLLAMLLAVPTSWIFKMVTDKRPRELLVIASLLNEIRTRKPDPPTTTHARMISQRAADAGGEKGGNMIEGWLNRAKEPHKTRMKKLYHVTIVLISTGTTIYSFADMIKTACKWSSLGGDLTSSDGKWEKSWSLYTTLVVVAISCPISKISPRSKRDPMGKSLRLFSWGITSGLNIFKSGATDKAKPMIAAANGIVDLTMYLSAVAVEQNKQGNPQDSAMEITNRCLSAGWALVSAYNGVMSAKEPVGLIVGAALGVGYNVQSFVLLQELGKYQDKHDSTNVDGDWDPPTLANSLNGSM